MTSPRKRAVPDLKELKEDSSNLPNKRPKEEIILSSDGDDDDEISSSSYDTDDKDKMKKKNGRKLQPKKAAETEESDRKQVLPNFLLKIVPMPVPRRNSMSVAEKLEIVKCLQTGETQYAVATRLKLNRSTVHNIWKQREKLLKAAEDGNANMKKCRMPNSVEMEEILVSWISHRSAEGNHPNGPEIRDHAKVVAKSLGMTDFTASHGWLDRFKERNEIVLPKSRKLYYLTHGIQKPRKSKAERGHVRRVANKSKDSKITTSAGTPSAFSSPPQIGDHDHDDFNDGHWDQAMSQSQNSIEPLPKFPSTRKNAASSSSKKATNVWLRNTWSEISTGYRNEDIFFGDELGLFYSVPPEKYKDFQNKSCCDGECAGDRLSVLFGVNSSGTEKLKLAVVGSSTYPTSFGENWNQTQQDKLPVEYCFHPKSFITADIIASWLSRWNAKLETSGSERKVLMLFRNSRAHENLPELCKSLNHIKILILPATEAAMILNHLEDGIGQQFKIAYKKLLLDKFIRRKMENSSGNLKVSILEATGLLQAAWVGLEESSINETFQVSGLIRKISEEQVLSTAKKRRNAEDRSHSRSLVQCAKTSGLKYPKELNFSTFADIDENLIAVDQSLEIIDTRQNLVDNDEPPCTQLPSGHSILNCMDHLRYWAVIGGGNNLTKLHEAIGTIQSFCMKNLVPPLTLSPLNISALSSSIVQSGTVNKSNLPLNNPLNENSGLPSTAVTVDMRHIPLSQAPAGAEGQYSVVFPGSVNNPNHSGQQFSNISYVVGGVHQSHPQLPQQPQQQQQQQPQHHYGNLNMPELNLAAATLLQQQHHHGSFANHH